MRKSHYSFENQVFLELLKACRLDRGLRQRDLASRIGRGQALVSKVESGERRLDVIELRSWLGAIGVDFVGFVSDLDERLKGRTISFAFSVRNDTQAIESGMGKKEAKIGCSIPPRKRSGRL